ncbi:HEAT repeat domain-containing protein [Urbifossiella limnaea]|uniref:HEAT repeat domain-containing protein n=1 Tax=Urbifossiella limnaea TaxID=2528023 RepID=A0A517XSB4_9BACT|nr:HEAT repeat domain-containing protein [Urbifossiella limnaea]QDU20401.1 hypothetical protein ETAA1_23530 [Urbifossiella limnaea]
MAHGRGWKRGAIGLGLVVAAAGAWAWANRADLGARYAARQLTRAASDDERTAWAVRLVEYGDAARGSVVGLVVAGSPEVRAAIVPVVENRLGDQPDGDPATTALAEALLDGFAACDAGGQEAVLSLAPALLKRTGPAGAARCQAATTTGLKLPSAAARLAAIRAAMHPLVKLRTEVVPLLAAAEADVRRAALFAVGPATDDEPVIGDEDLFRWLHDPDAGVRRVCQDALASRGRTDTEIRLGRRLTNPDPGERLDLLLDLRSDDDVPDAEPWLERLARDADPGVRAGAARVAAEMAAERRQALPPWVTRLAEADPEPTVRRIAAYYRAASGRVDGAVRPVSGN